MTQAKGLSIFRFDHGAYVPIDGAVTINDLKTFTTIPQIPVTDPTLGAEVISKAFLDFTIGGLSAIYVPIDGAITINDLKTFSTIPQIPITTPTLGPQVVSKAYLDTRITALGTVYLALDGSNANVDIDVSPYIFKAGGITTGLLTGTAGADMSFNAPVGYDINMSLGGTLDADRFRINDSNGQARFILSANGLVRVYGNIQKSTGDLQIQTNAGSINLRCGSDDDTYGSNFRSASNAIVASIDGTGHYLGKTAFFTNITPTPTSGRNASFNSVFENDLDDSVYAHWFVSEHNPPALPVAPNSSRTTIAGYTTLGNNNIIGNVYGLLFGTFSAFSAYNNGTASLSGIATWGAGGFAPTLVTTGNIYGGQFYSILSTFGIVDGVLAGNFTAPNIYAGYFHSSHDIGSIGAPVVDCETVVFIEKPQLYANNPVNSYQLGLGGLGDFTGMFLGLPNSGTAGVAIENYARVYAPNASELRIALDVSGTPTDRLILTAVGLNIVGTIENSGGRIKPPTVVDTATYDILISDYEVLFDGAQAQTGEFPVGADGQSYRLKNTGNAGFNVTINLNGGAFYATLYDGESIIRTWSDDLGGWE